MKTPGLNLGAWWGLLVRGTSLGRSPELIPEVRPVAVVGQHARMTNRIEPPSAWFGGSVTGAPATLACFQVQAFAPGGARVRSLRLASTTAGPVRFAFLPPTALATPHAGHLEQAEPTLVAVSSGTVAVGAPRTTAADPVLHFTANGNQELTAELEAFFIPPGFCLYVESTTLSNTLHFAVRAGDVLA